MPLHGPAIDLPRPFGPYTLLRRLAVGGMAEVYVAKTRGLGGFERLVAIKLIHPRLSEDEHFVQMLVEEAKLSVLLTHANIGQTFDLGRIEGGAYFIVMEYIEGADAYRVQQRLAKERGQLPLDICAFIVAEVCQGLDYAHRKRDLTGAPLNIVHRDISPQNVLLSYAGEVKIVDFGIAKAAMRSAQTEVGVIKGKYYYMSPEQAWADPVDLRSDIFSAGVVLHELLTGEMLYQGNNLPELLDRVRRADIQPPSRRRPDVPPELDAIVMKAVARHPSERYRSAHDFGQALTRFLYKRSPSFTAGRLSALMGRLFAEERTIAEGEHPAAVQAGRSGELHTRDGLPVESTGALEVMRPDEFRPDITKSVIFDLRDFDDERTRDEKRRRLLAAIEREDLDETDDEHTMVQLQQTSWSDESTDVTPGELRSQAVGHPAEESWGDATLVDDRGDVFRRMREALEREVAVRNKAKRPETGSLASSTLARPWAPPPLAPGARRPRAAPPHPGDGAARSTERSQVSRVADLSRETGGDLLGSKEGSRSESPSSQETPLGVFRVDEVGPLSEVAPRWMRWVAVGLAVVVVVLLLFLLRCL